MPRPSPVTDEVRRLFEKQERHAWSIDELHDNVRSSLGSADYSSVFRAVSVLEKQGLIDRIDLGEGHARFDLDGSGTPHWPPSSPRRTRSTARMRRSGSKRRRWGR